VPVRSPSQSTNRVLSDQHVRWLASSSVHSFKRLLVRRSVHSLFAVSIDKRGRVRYSSVATGVGTIGDEAARSISVLAATYVVGFGRRQWYVVGAGVASTPIESSVGELK
jgi:hypothetical protein